MNFKPNEVAVTQSAVNASKSVAIGTDGRSGVVSTEVTNNISGEQELQITIVNTGDTDASNVPIFVPTGGAESDYALPADVEIEYGEFPSRKAALCHFGRTPFGFGGLTLETDKGANILQNGLIISKRNAIGQLDKITKNFTKYRGKMGNGDVDLEMSIPAQDATYVVMPNMGIALRKLAANSSVTITLVVTAVQDTVKLVPVAEARL